MAELYLPTTGVRTLRGGLNGGTLSTYDRGPDSTRRTQWRNFTFLRQGSGLYAEDSMAELYLPTTGVRTLRGGLDGGTLSTYARGPDSTRRTQWRNFTFLRQGSGLYAEDSMAEIYLPTTGVRTLRGGLNGGTLPTYDSTPRGGLNGRTLPTYDSTRRTQWQNFTYLRLYAEDSMAELYLPTTLRGGFNGGTLPTYDSTRRTQWRKFTYLRLYAEDSMAELYLPTTLRGGLNGGTLPTYDSTQRTQWRNFTYLRLYAEDSMAELYLPTTLRGGLNGGTLPTYDSTQRTQWRNFTYLRLYAEDSMAELYLPTTLRGGLNGGTLPTYDSTWRTQWRNFTYLRLYDGVFLKMQWWNLKKCGFHRSFN